MRRRTFLAWCGATVVLHASVPLLPLQRRFDAVAHMLRAVLRHMFPPASFLSAEVALLAFIRNTIFHSSYDKDIRLFVIEGAETFARRFGDFPRASASIKEAQLRSFEQDRYGSAWLSRIMILAVEGLLSDPIYGVNTQETYWRMLHTQGGVPRPQTRYIWG